MVSSLCLRRGAAGRNRGRDVRAIREGPAWPTPMMSAAWRWPCPAWRRSTSEGFDFRVGGHGFIWSYPERQPGQRRVIRTDIAVLFVGDEAEKQALLLGEPGIFFTAPGYDGRPLVLLRLAEVDTGRLEELVTDAWRMRASDSSGGRST